ncbi:MAG: SPOR domain-containing protein [Hyphomonadaceae bacterium]|nr:SPOR domain-containing protein [Hyphomonadaceae bacterium]
MHEYEDRSRSAGMIYVLMIVVAAAFGGFVWQLYSAPEIPRISAPAGPYKMAPAPDAAGAPDPTEQGAFYDALEGRTVGVEATPRPGPEVVSSTPPPAPAGPPQLAPAPRFVGSGPYVAQLAALQSEAAVDAAWRRMASRAPDLFAQARLDVERADLGARGIYHRVRAGYFADRENATRFCERIRQMGQDCIVVSR